jgi:hypothetical protein
MAVKRRLKDSTISEEDKDIRIKRLESLLKEVTEELGRVVGYKDKPVAELRRTPVIVSCYRHSPAANSWPPLQIRNYELI